MVFLCQVNSTILIDHFIVVNFKNSFDVNVLIFKHAFEVWGFYELATHSLLHIFLNLLLETEENKAVLLLDKFDKLFVLLFL